MAIDKGLVQQKLKILEDFVSTIDHMDFTAVEMLESKDIQDLICFRLQQAVEITIDIANHLVSALALPQKDTAADVFLLLGKEKIITVFLADKMKDASRFRNLVVHHYAKVDFRKLHRNYQDDLADLRRFAKEIYEFLEKQK